MMPIRLTPTVKALMAICFAVFVIQQTGDQFFGTHFLATFALVPSSVIMSFKIWQVFTYSFLHGDVLHLFLNLMMLAFIGSELEMIWGRARFLRFYFFCATVAALTYLVLQLFVYQANAPMLGASGAIYGLLMAYGLIFGDRVLLFMMLFPLKAKHFIWVLAGIEFMSTIYSGPAALAGVAHLGGMAAGFGLLWGRAAWVVFARRLREGQEHRERSRRVKGTKHLKLVVNKPGKGGKSGKPGSSKDGSDDSDDAPKTWH